MALTLELQTLTTLGEAEVLEEAGTEAQETLFSPSSATGAE